MGLDILVPDANFSSAPVAFASKVSVGLEGLWFFNREPERARKNLVVGKPDATVIGSPVLIDNALRFRGNLNFMQTEVMESEAMTIIAAVKSNASMADAANSPMYVSTLGAPSAIEGKNTFGSAIYSNLSTTTITGTASRFTDATNTDVTSDGRTRDVGSIRNWTLFVNRFRNDRHQVDNLTTGSAGAANFTTNRVPSAGKFRIGSSYSSSWQGECDIAFVAIFSRYIDDAELATKSGQVKPALSRMNIQA